MIPRSSGVGSVRWVIACAVEENAASPGAAPATGLPRVRAKKFGGSVGDSRRVRNRFFGRSSQATKLSYSALPLRKSRSVFRVLRSRRSRKGRSPSGDEPKKVKWTAFPSCSTTRTPFGRRSEEHTSELQSRGHLVCRLLLEKKKGRDFDLPALAEAGSYK